MRILVVDDSKLMQEIIQDALAPFGFPVTLARDGEEAWELIQHDSFDIVITDWEMPRMNGIDLIQNVRAMPADTYPYLILITSHDEEERYCRALDVGADDFLPKPISPETLRARVRAGSRIVSMQRELARLAMTDSLTGALNRRAFMERGAIALERARRHGRPLSLLLLDIDHFKRINDTYGHAAGDEALKGFVATIRGALRPIDALGRLGGEEFAVLLADAALPDAISQADAIRQATEALCLTRGEDQLRFTTSIGVASVATGAATGVEDALHDADEALYVAKRGGRNRVEIASPRVVKARAG